jgi:pimeloyl-ACP methyl ester carboxylesterase
MGSGPLLVMCHGLLTANLATWYFSAAPALARHYQVVLYDLRGHGKSDLTATGYDLDTMAQDLSYVIAAYQAKAAKSTQVMLVGHSYGALIALHHALLNPQGVAALALIDAPLPAARYIYPSFDGVDSLALRTQFPASVEEQPAPASRREQRAHARLEFLSLHSSLRDDLRAAVDVPDARLRTLQIPTLCLYGRQSDCAAAGERLARLLPRGELRWLDCDHFVPTHSPAEMTQQLLSYFTSNESEVMDHVLHHGIG